MMLILVLVKVTTRLGDFDDKTLRPEQRSWGGGERSCFTLFGVLLLVSCLKETHPNIGNHKETLQLTQGLSDFISDNPCAVFSHVFSNHDSCDRPDLDSCDGPDLDSCDRPDLDSCDRPDSEAEPQSCDSRSLGSSPISLGVLMLSTWPFRGLRHEALEVKLLLICSCDSAAMA